ncbi:MAG TPA: hypothetical protein VH595_17170 [Verrucomicrobiae bacterium]|jgi:hypothetical protein|nr:hypothetical protein [Verrucomicrobiae bacterium]
MIQLSADCLIFQTNDGQQVPCSAEWVTLELMGEGAQLVDPEVVRHASAAVLHYFKHELHRQFVSVAEFAAALEKVLRSFGLSVYADQQSPATKGEERRVLDSNLQTLASSAAAEGFELLFFPQLRQELQRQLQQAPQVVRFRGLRDCVKQLAGAPRWNRRCQSLNDQIVEFLRSCWETENASQSCALVVL